MDLLRGFDEQRALRHLQLDAVDRDRDQIGAAVVMLTSRYRAVVKKADAFGAARLT